MTTISEKAIVTLRADIKARVEKVWKLWTDPKHIIHWNKASEDWHTPEARNDLRVGGKFLSRMEAKDSSEGFDFTGHYTYIEPHKQIEYTIDDGRKVQISFDQCGNETSVIEMFEADRFHSIELQYKGWQAILNNFKKYTESSP